MSITLPNSRQTLHWIGLFVLILIVVPFVVYAVPGVVGAEGSYVVLSGSMEPSINTGDVVIVDGATPESIEEGDVITYLRSGAETPTTHRVVEITEQDGELAFVTQGDANDQPDASPVPASQLLGVVIFTIPFIGYVIEFVNTPLGFVMLVVIPLLLLVALEVRSMFRGSNSTPTQGEGSTSSTTAESADSEKMESNTDSSDGTIELTRSDLRLSLGILIGTAAYASWVAYHIQEAWSFAVAFASCIGMFLVGGMYYIAGNGSSDDSKDTVGDITHDLHVSNGSDDGTSTRHIVNGSLKTDRTELSQVTVDSLEALVSMAASEDEWIIADSETNGYYLCRDSVVYEFYPETEPEDETFEQINDGETENGDLKAGMNGSLDSTQDSGTKEDRGSIDRDRTNGSTVTEEVHE